MSDPLSTRALRARASLESANSDRAIPVFSAPRHSRPTLRTWAPALAAAAVLVVVLGAVWGGTQVPRPVVTRGVVSTVPVAERPGQVATDGELLWVLDEARSEVIALDAHTLRTRWRTAARGRPTGLAVGAGTLWVVTADARLLQLDPRRGRLLDERRTSLDPIAVDVAFGAVWVLSRGNQTLDRYGTDPVAQTASAVLGSGVRGLTHSAGVLWVCATGGLRRVSPAAHGQLAVATVAVAGGCASASADAGGSLWVVTPAGRVTARRATTGSELAGVALSAPATALAATKDGLLVATSDGLLHEVSRPGASSVTRADLGSAVDFLAVHSDLVVGTARSTALLYATEVAP